MHPWVRSRTGLARCRNPRPFHDEIVDYAERLTVAGVPADLQIVPGAFHAFDDFVTKAQVSRNFLRQSVRESAERVHTVRAGSVRAPALVGNPYLQGGAMSSPRFMQK
jgi:hypothetical protein